MKLRGQAGHTELDHLESSSKDDEEEDSAKHDDDELLTSESDEDFTQAQQAFDRTESNRYEFFQKMKQKRIRNPQKAFIKLVKFTRQEERVNIMHSDEERERRKRVENDMHAVKMIIGVRLREVIDAAQYKCCGRLWISCKRTK